MSHSPAGLPCSPSGIAGFSVLRNLCYFMLCSRLSSPPSGDSQAKLSLTSQPSVERGHADS